MKKIKSIIITFVFAAALLFGTVICIAKPSAPYSLSERRELAKFPQFTLEAVMNGEFMKDFENLANLLYFSTSLTDAAYENSIVEHKAILDAVKEKDYLKVVEALEDHLIKHFLPEERA